MTKNPYNTKKSNKNLYKVGYDRKFITRKLYSAYPWKPFSNKQEAIKFAKEYKKGRSNTMGTEGDVYVVDKNNKIIYKT